jgi:predicted RNA-binding protein associated with RNAse of E/G family
LQRFEQRLVARDGHALVTLLERADLPRPSVVDGDVILEPGSPIVWFSFAGARHDIGRFHRADGTFTGLYANILTPVAGLDGAEWTTTDLFLDVWLPARGDARVLDVDELSDALARGWVDDLTGALARAEADRLLAGVANGTWPPPVVARWTLERARAELRHLSGRGV